MTLQFWAEFLVSRFFFVVPMVVALAVWWWMQRWMDISAGIKFREVWGAIKDGNQAVADYRGRRAIAVAIIVAGVTIAGAISAQL